MNEADVTADALAAALKWVVDNRVVGGKTLHNPVKRVDGNWAVAGYSEAGCGCCGGYELVPPDDVKRTLDAILGA